MEYDFNDLIEWRIEELFKTKNYRISDDKTKILVVYNVTLSDDVLRVYHNIKEFLAECQQTKDDVQEVSCYGGCLVNKYLNDLIDIMSGVYQKNRFCHRKMGKLLAEAHEWHKENNTITLCILCCDIKIVITYDGKQIHVKVNLQKEQNII